MGLQFGAGGRSLVVTDPLVGLGSALLDPQRNLGWVHGLVPRAPCRQPAGLAVPQDSGRRSRLREKHTGPWAPGSGRGHCCPGQSQGQSPFQEGLCSQPLAGKSVTRPRGTPRTEPNCCGFRKSLHAHVCPWSSPSGDGRPSDRVTAIPQDNNHPSGKVTAIPQTGWVLNPVGTREIVGSIPGLAQWVKDPALP